MEMKLHTQIFLGIILGVFCGILLRENAGLLQPIGDIFIRLLRMMIIPIVFSSLVVGVISLGNIQGLGRLGGRTLIYYLTTTIIAIIIGLVIVNIVKPGVGADFPMTASYQVNDIPSSESIFLGVINQIVPHNIIKAAVDDQILSIIFFSIFFGTALIYLGKRADPVKKLVESFNTIVLKMTDWIMQLAPLGVFALMASLVGKIGIEAFKPLAFYMAVVLIGLGIHTIVILPSALIFIAKYSPITLFKKMFPAFATAEGSRTLPAEGLRM